MSAGEKPGTDVALVRPVSAHGEEVSLITLRAPVVEDFMQLGQPFLLVVDEDETAIRIQPKTVAQYIVRQGQVPMSTVKSLELADFAKCQAVIVGFFGANAAEQ